MCLHTSTPDKKALKAWLEKGVRIEDYEAHYHSSGFSHPVMPVILQKEPDKVQGAVWGFLPTWAKPEETGKLMNKTLNARAETIFTTPMYRAAAPGHRCLVLVDGFFEWKHEQVGGRLRKIPHYIRMPDHRPFALGGLYAHWIDKEEDIVLTTCNIITTPANDLMATIHNSKKRMPLILPEDKWDVWLDETATPAQVKKVMKKYPEGALEAYEVDLSLKRGEETDVPEVQDAVR